MTSEGKLAFVFPGQGSQKTGMGREAAERYREAHQVFDAADAALGFSLSALCFEGPDEELKLTENTQPALLATSTALSEVLRAHGVEPDYVAGHSLGEYSALVLARALRLPEALSLVRKRGGFMQRAVPADQGAMAAIVGLSGDEVQAVCRQAAEGQVVEPANLNGAGQVVVAGHKEAVGRACKLARSAGARRAIPLSVSAPFHCRLMAPAARELARELERVEFSDLLMPLVTNVDARPITRGEEARDALIRQVASPVRWEETVEVLVSAGVRRFVEVGPGTVLSGLLRKTVRDASVYSVASPSDVERFLTEAKVV